MELSLVLAWAFVLNAPPAKIFMGDTGSLSLGGSLGAVGIITNMRLYWPLRGLFVLEAVSSWSRLFHIN